ncbi:MAG: glycerophosphoryl diester phosphodiesterase membrane domain-containing protein [Bacillota bacterium]|nr:glycerophosphoryl diester phosphodiesterase membrane domain-containing protein [Bacillota bacterium]
MDYKRSFGSGLSKVAWLYAKYQLITKGLLALLVFPIASGILHVLLASSGRTNLSSGDYLEFLFSFHGAGLLALAMGLLILLIGVDVNAFIIMSALVKEGRIETSARQMLWVAITSLKSFLKPSGILIMLYIALIIPLVGIGVTISPMEDFQIPNFITDVIFKNSLYSSLYVALMLLLSYLSLRYIFFFHYVLILEEPIGDALRRASSLMKRHWKSFLKDFILWSMLWTLAAGALLFVSVLLFVLPSTLIPASLSKQRFWMILGLIVIAELLAFAALMTVPIVCYRLTELFYRYHERDGFPVKMKREIRASHFSFAAGSGLRTKSIFGVLISAVLLFNLAAASLSGDFFEELFRRENRIQIVAHRGGGDLGAENSLAGLEAAISEGVEWSEIDVQRTKDGRYILNHDSNFARLAGHSGKASELSLEEIKGLEVKDLFDPARPSQKVPSLEEVLALAKGRIGLFIELKGESADEKMVDDLVEMVKAYEMEKEVALLSLDYELIRYIEKNYPEMESGFLYFFSIGDLAKMEGDILIMEEREATPNKIAEIHAAGKKAVVWTVNSEKSIQRFVNSEVDAIITDYVSKLKEGMKQHRERSDLRVLLDYFLP